MSLNPPPAGARQSGVARGVLSARQADARARTLALVAPLTAEDQCVQSMPDASPALWLSDGWAQVQGWSAPPCWMAPGNPRAPAFSGLRLARDGAC